MEKIDLVLEMQKRQHASIIRVHDKIDDLSEKVGSTSLQVESRLSKVEAHTSLRNRALMAIVALLPAISLAAYFLVRMVA